MFFLLFSWENNDILAFVVNLNMDIDLTFLPILVQEILAGTPVSTDSRRLVDGSIFFALDGERFKGSEFIEEALESGASWVITHDLAWKNHPRAYVVGDSLDALQAVAYAYRRTLGLSTQFLAIVGSNGKTTTKELIRTILSQEYLVQATAGNLNNHIGVPLTLLSIRPETQIAIIEMGANHMGEIAKYCEIVDPNFGLITNISQAHIGEFGSEAKVFQAKTELYRYLARKKEGAGVFVNIDYPELLAATENLCKLSTYSQQSSKATIIGRSLVSADCFLKLELEEDSQRYSVSTKLVGKYNLENVLAATSVGRYFRVPMSKIVEAIEQWRPQNFRSQLLKYEDNYFILDAYNANPRSMYLALEAFYRLSQADTDKVVILGGMQELGTYSKEEHSKIQDYVAQYEWECIFVGTEWEERDFGQYFYNSSQAIKYFKSRNFQNKIILLKGSRSHKLENFVGENV